MEEMSRSRVDRLIRECRPALERLAARLCRGAADREDLVQGTILRALEGAHLHIDNVENGGGHGWLATIMWNLFLDGCRKAENRLPHDDVDEVPVRMPEHEPEPFWAGVTTEQFQAALEKLDDLYRIPLELFEMEQKSQREIGEILNIRPATVAKRVMRARGQLKKLLEQRRDSKDEH